MESIIHFSIHNKFLVGLGTLLLIGAGLLAARQIPLDAVPDITNNQVQVVTVSQSLAPQEVEQLITYPIEVAMANIPGVTEIRSISRFGLSVVTVVFEEAVPGLDARQYVREQIDVAVADIPPGLGMPELMPITTGLGEIYQYTLEVTPAKAQEYDPMRLRTIQDWIVKRQLSGIPGVVEVSSFGGYLKQYEVAVDPLRLNALGLTIADVFDALAANNENSGGSYIAREHNAYYIRTEGRAETPEEIGEIVVANRSEIPVLVRDVAKVQLGHPARFGAMTKDGKGEAVGGIVLMLKGANSSQVIGRVQDRVAEIQNSLPEGVRIRPYLDRSELIGKAIDTVSENLLLGGLIVVFVLLLLLGNWRAGLIVASVIPLSLLFALGMMYLFGVSANLMSLGAIDFGIVVDGAVIIVESSLHVLFTSHIGKRLSQDEMDETIYRSTVGIYRSAAFGVLIILVVFLPILTLEGIEGKMFRPMAQTVSFAILGAMVLSLTYVPMVSALFLKKHIRESTTWSDRLMGGLRNAYRPILRAALRLPYLVLAFGLGLLLMAGWIFSRMGGEFIPTLDEGDLAMQMAIQPGSSLEESILTTTRAEQMLLRHFPEVKSVVSKIGTAEVPTDPMAIEDADIMIILKEKSEWVSAKSREALVEKMKEKLAAVPGASFEFTQPIQLRFNELITGAKTDVAVKIFGENTEVLAEQAEVVANVIRQVPGAADVKIEQTEGLQQLVVEYDRVQIARYGLDIVQLNLLIRSAYAGEVAGFVFEGERKFDLVVRLDQAHRQQLDLSRLYVRAADGHEVNLSQVAKARFAEGPLQVSREDTRRRITIGVNVRDRDVASLVTEIQQRVASEVRLPPGYFIRYGGQFENLQNAQQRLAIAVPIALAMIFILLYFAFSSAKYALLIFSAVPLSAVGGVLALWLRDMPFSISAGVGFIALFGVAVLNGIVLIAYLNQLKNEGKLSLHALIEEGALSRLRPVLMTALVAALGFLPMAISTSAGAEVQKPLATVVVGGLVSSTLLTLFVLPVLYLLANRRAYQPKVAAAAASALLVFLFWGNGNTAQAQTPPSVELNQLIELAQQNPQARQAEIQIQIAESQARQAFSLQPLNVNFQRGQIDGEVASDYNLTISQNFGNIPAYFTARQLANAQTATQQAQLFALRYQLAFQVRHLWNDWLYAQHRLRSLNKQEAQLLKARQLTQQQLAAGEVDATALALAQLSLQNLQAQQAAIGQEAQTAEAGLRQLAGADIALAFAGQPFPLLLADTAQTQITDTLAQPLEAAIRAGEQNIRHQLRGAFPQLTGGYTLQQLQGIGGFESWQVGLYIPILSKNRQNVAQAQLQVAQQQAGRNQQQQQWAAQLRQARQNLRLLGEQISTLQLQDSPDHLTTLLNQQLAAGTLRLTDFAYQMQTVTDARLRLLTLRYQYNRAALQWQYLTGSQN